MTTLFTNGNLVDVIGQTVLTGGSHTQPGHFLLHGHLPFFYP